MLCLIQTLCVMMNSIDEDASFKYHDYQGFEGWTIIVFKFGVWLFLLYFWMRTRDKVTKKHKRYFKLCFVVGSIHMLTVPVTILTTFLFEPYQRQTIFDVASHTVNFMTTVVTLYQVTFKESSWRTLNLSNVSLPTDHDRKD